MLAFLCGIVRSSKKLTYKGAISNDLVLLYLHARVKINCGFLPDRGHRQNGNSCPFAAIYD
jgi:hypothetical protein